MSVWAGCKHIHSIAIIMDESKMELQPVLIWLKINSRTEEAKVNKISEIYQVYYNTSQAYHVFISKF